VKESKKKWVLDCPNLLIVWLVKFGTILSWEEVFAFKGIGFQLQQHEAMSPCGLSTMPNLFIP
jgi:hypothetical protein